MGSVPTLSPQCPQTPPILTSSLTQAAGWEEVGKRAFEGCGSLWIPRGSLAGRIELLSVCPPNPSHGVFYMSLHPHWGHPTPAVWTMVRPGCFLTVSGSQHCLGGPSLAPSLPIRTGRLVMLGFGEALGSQAYQRAGLSPLCGL